MDRAETTGLGVALVAHGGLFAALSLGLGAAQLPVMRADPIEVSFTEDVGLISSAPATNSEPPAPSIAPDLGPPELAAPTPTGAIAVPPPRPSSAPAAQQRQKANQSAKAVNRGSRFGADFMKGVNPDPSTSRSETPPAKTAGAAVVSSLIAEVRRQLKPHWQRAVPTGADVESLKTELTLTLARDGSVIHIDVVGTTGINASNRPQVTLHQERAKRAATLASPFELPNEYYDEWRQMNVTMDVRLAR